MLRLHISLVLVLCLYSADSVFAQGGWRMAGHDGSRTNVSPATGPRTLPTFQQLIVGALGNLQLIGPDGSLVFYSGDQYGGSLSTYTSAGALKWSVPTALNSVAIRPDGKIITSSITYTPGVAAFDQNTGQEIWFTPFDPGTFGNETSALAVDAAGVVYINTGASFVGVPQILRAINSDGTLKWQQQLTFRGYVSPVLAFDGSSVFIPTCNLVFPGAICYPLVDVFATGDGHQLGAVGLGGLASGSPWDTVYFTPSGVQSVYGLFECTASASSCAQATDRFLSGVQTFIGTSALISRVLLPPSYSGQLQAVDRVSGAALWTATENFEGGIADANGTLYIVDPDTYDVVGLNGLTGAELWRKHFPSKPQSLFLGDDGSLYFQVANTLYKSSGGTSTGTINVATNLAPASFTITGPATYNGGGMSFSQPNAPAGTYQITYGDVPGYDKPAPETKILAAGDSITFSGVYTLQTGTINITSTPVGAGFRLVGPGYNQLLITPFTLTNATPGSWTVTWSILLGGYSTPVAQTQSLSAGGTVAFVGRYLPITTRAAPYDFFASCMDQNAFGNGEVPILNSDPISGHMSLGIHATVVGNAFGQTGAGFTYIPTFSGSVRIRATFTIGPNLSSDALTILELPKVGKFAIESVDSKGFVSATPSSSPLVVATKSFRTAILTPISGGTDAHGPLTVDSQVYNPAKQFTADLITSVTAGQKVDICGGVQSKVVSTVPVPFFGEAVARYEIQLNKIEVFPQ